MIWQNYLCMLSSMPVIWWNCLYVEKCASDLADLPVPMIRQKFLSVDSVPVIWQNCLYMEKCASDLAELPVSVIWQN